MRTRGRDATHKDKERGVYAYQPTPYGGLTPAVTACRLDPSRFSFVDLGCGKGAALWAALDLGFARVVGVELVPEYLEAARANLAAVESRRGRAIPVELILGDAAGYRLPPEPLVVFMFNPFGRDVLGRVVAGLESSLAASPRPLYVIYSSPEEEQVLAASPALRLWERGSSWVVYRSRDPASSGPAAGRPVDPA